MALPQGGSKREFRGWGGSGFPVGPGVYKIKHSSDKKKTKSTERLSPM
jgi:hypothetical protein